MSTGKWNFFDGRSPSCRFRAVLAGLFLLLFLSGTASATCASEKKEPAPLPKYLSLGTKAKRFYRSHTSYEFGNPFRPCQSPLSRLEFPLDRWWYGAEVRASAPWFSIGLEVLRSTAGDASENMRDSDWDDDAQPNVLTVYSESKCRVERSTMYTVDIDVDISDWANLPPGFNIRPVWGFRRQNFRFLVHDAIQYELGYDPESLAGNIIRFKQTYSHYFFGLKSHFHIGRILGISSLHLLTQLDWAYVVGHNEDHHLLRIGNRFTYEDTRGQAWHASVGLKMGLDKNLTLGLDWEHLYIKTTGIHRLVHDVFNIDYTWAHDVKVWSKQTSYSISLEYRF